MSHDAWLIVLGAGLAIVTQLASEFFRHRNEDRRQTRAARREAYTSFLAMLTSFDINHEAVAALRLVAPFETFHAAAHLMDTVHAKKLAKDAGEDSDELVASTAAAYTKFCLLAHRDLGLTDMKIPKD